MFGPLLALPRTLITEHSPVIRYTGLSKLLNYRRKQIRAEVGSSETD